MVNEPIEASSQLTRAVIRSGRKTTVQLPISFARQSGPNPDPPLARILRGGRGGETRLRLYLTLVMLATKYPYTLPSPTTDVLAATLNLPDPKGAGARRVNASLKWLESQKLIRRSKRPGQTPLIEILHPSGSGETWEKERGPRFIGLPLELWSQFWILKMTGRALAVFVALRELTGGETAPGWAPGPRKAEYGLSADTWTRATAELEELGLLRVDSVVDHGDYELPRRRNKHELIDAALSTAPVW